MYDMELYCRKGWETVHLSAT